MLHPPLLSPLFLLMSRLFKQSDVLFELAAGEWNIPHAYSFSAACDSLSNLLEHWSHITYFHLQVAFVPVLRLPKQQYMNICKCVSLIMHLTCLWFKLSVLMGHLQMNYTTFDAWLTVLIFGLCKLLLWRASQAAVRPSWSVNRRSSPSRSVDMYDNVWAWVSDQAETSHLSVRQEFGFDAWVDFGLNKRINIGLVSRDVDRIVARPF